MKAILLAVLALSLKWVEYRFNRDYGDFFFDYSLNGRYGVNGNTNSITKVVSCDRGVYLKNSRSFISITSTTAFPFSFTMSTWLLSKDSTVSIFYYIDANISFMIGRGDAADRLRFYMFTGITYGTENCFPPCII